MLEKAEELARLKEKLDSSNILSEKDKANFKKQIDNLTKEKEGLKKARVEAETNARNSATAAAEAERMAAVAAEKANAAKEAEANAVKEAKYARDKQADTEKTLNTERKNANNADVKAARAEAEAEAAKTQAAAAANALNSTLKKLDNEREKLSKKTEEAARTQGKLDSVEEMGPAAAATAAAAAATAAAAAATSRAVETTAARPGPTQATETISSVTNVEPNDTQLEDATKDALRKKDIDNFMNAKEVEKIKNLMGDRKFKNLVKKAYDSFEDKRINNIYRYSKYIPSTSRLSEKDDDIKQEIAEAMRLFLEKWTNGGGGRRNVFWDQTEEENQSSLEDWLSTRIKNFDAKNKKVMRNNLLYKILCLRMSMMFTDKDLIANNEGVYEVQDKGGGSRKKLKYSVKISNHNGKNTNNVGKQFSQNKGRQRKKSVKRRKR